jgi:hypothetical protein
VPTIAVASEGPNTTIARPTSEHARTEPATERHRCDEQHVGQAAQRVAGAVAVDRRHAEPVVAGALGECHRQHEQSDEQRARFLPGGERAVRGLVARLLLTGGRKERSGAPRHHGRDDGHHHQQMDGHRDIERVHPGTDQCTCDGAHAECGVEARHDGTAQPLLDGRSLDVHRDVPGARAEAGRDETDRDHRRPDHHADGRDGDTGGEHHRQEEDGPAGAQSMHDQPGERERDERADRQHQEQHAECARRELEFVSDLRDARQPTGHTGPRADERDVHAARGSAEFRGDDRGLGGHPSEGRWFPRAQR